MSTPTDFAASMTVVPGFTTTSLPSMVAVTNPGFFGGGGPGGFGGATAGGAAGLFSSAIAFSLRDARVRCLYCSTSPAM
jgi:hypothetical protein